MSRYKIGFLAVLIYCNCLTYAPVFSQDNRPEKPEIVVVSIDSITNKTIVKWKKSNTPNILSYNIYTVDTTTSPVTGTLLGSVPGDSLSFSSSASEKESIYTVTATNTGNESLLSGDYHKPAILHFNYDSCAAEINLSWEPYIGWENSIAGYRIYEKKGDVDFTIAFEVNSQISEITIRNVDENTNYEYVIETFNNQGINSTSNRIKYYTFMPDAPEFVNIDQVSIVDNSAIQITISAGITSEVDDFQLTRAGSPTANYIPIATIRDMTNQTTVLTDDTPLPGRTYYYRVEVLNSCNNPIAYSNIGNNLILEDSISKINNRLYLSWNEYTGFYGDLDGYEIYRISSTGEHIPVGNAYGEATDYSVDLDMLKYNYSNGNLNEGKLIYYVQAVEASTNLSGYRGVSKSNELMVPLETEMIIPNAFNPGPNGADLNRTFAPVLSFSPQNYQMHIYDRSGRILFSTTDPRHGWDGNIDGGGVAIDGVYIFHIEYQSHNGSRKAKTGNVTLIRQ